MILALESSCDETAVAVFDPARGLMGEWVHSQIALHEAYGGVVPDLASREHLQNFGGLLHRALAVAPPAAITRIAVTNGPGLAACLAMGLAAAKSLGLAWRVPVVGVNHLRAHAFSPFIALHAAQPAAFDHEFAQLLPHLGLLVSGGNTALFTIDERRHVRLLAATMDDAAGEALDKGAKLLGLGYPGGPWIDALARFGDPKAVPFAFSQIKTKAHLAGKTPRTKAAETAPIADLDPHFLFSFSGIKTAVLRYVELHGIRAGVDERIAAMLAGARPPKTKEEALALCPQPILDLIASFQHAVVGDLLKKTFAASESLGANRILVTGGVAANRELRERFSVEAQRRGLQVSFPTLALSTDNAAMIAAAAWPRFLARDFAPESLSADASLALGR